MNVLLLIKPEFTKKIFSGEKKYEFRKQIPKKKIDTIIIYESFPRKEIVGEFTIKKIISGSPKDIWLKCRSAGGIEEKQFFKYCNGNENIYAFEIENVKRYDPPMKPNDIFINFRPPQNFQYLHDDLMNDFNRKLDEFF